VLQRLRESDSTKLTPVVVLTSSKEEEDVVAGYELGANSYIRKPVDADRFSSVVRQLGLYWTDLNLRAPR
jgi:DNA-binding response OmpR family regulator